VHQKTPAASGEGPFGLRWFLALAPVPPRPSVLLPGPGNEAEKATKTERKGAKKAEEGYVVGETQIFERHLHAATVRRDDDGDLAAIPTVEQAQQRSPCAADTRGVASSLAAIVKRVARATFRIVATALQSRRRRRSCRCAPAPHPGRWYRPTADEGTVDRGVVFGR
jgi:hypothetical protein